MEETISLSQLAKQAYNHRHSINVPQSELQELSTTSTVFTSCFFSPSTTLQFDVRPSLLQIEESKLSETFQKRAKQLCQMCNFSNENIQKEEKVQKSSMINDFTMACSNMVFVSKLTENDYRSLYKAFMKNVLRITPAPPPEWFAPVSLDFTSNKVLEVAWPHISIFYDLMYHFISNRKFKNDYCKNETLKIMIKLPPLFNCPDARERDKLKNLFFLFYRTFPFHVPACRKAIEEFVRESLEYGFIGINELLQMFIPILTTLSPDNVQRDFLQSVIPLHKVPYMHHFFLTFYTVVTSVVSSNPSIIPNVFDYLIKHWPKTAPQKAIFFLTEIEGMMSCAPYEYLQKQVVPLACLIKKCLNDENLMIVDRTLCLFENERIRSILTSYAKTVYPLIIPAIIDVSNRCFLPELKSIAFSITSMLRTYNREVYNQSSRDIFADMDKKRGLMWYSLMDYAKEMSPEEKDTIKTNLIKVFPQCKVSKELPVLTSSLTSHSSNSIHQVKIKNKLSQSTPIKPKVSAVSSYKARPGESIIASVLRKPQTHTPIKRPSQVPQLKPK